MTDTRVARASEVAVPTRHSAVTPMEMLRIAVEKGTDLAQLEKLMDLQSRWEASEARKAYVVALSAFKADPPSIIKNRSASFGGAGKTQYDYATLAQVAGVIAPALSKHGLSHGWSMKQDEASISVTCTLTHEQGHAENVTMRAPADTTGSKNAIQAIGSTVSYLERYTLLAITGLATVDQDDDGSGIVAYINAEQKGELIALMQEVGADTRKFLDYLGVPNMDSLPAKRFADAKAALEKKRRPA